MLNQIILVGRLINEPTMEEQENGNKKGLITLEIQRGYKNTEGEYDTDFIDVTLWTNIAEIPLNFAIKGM